MTRRPYDPSKSGPQVPVHDRRAREISRGTRGHIVEVEVEDPYEAGAKIATVRSIRDDPLGSHLARGNIDQAQYEAGRMFQKWYGLAERGPRALQLSEAVDGDPPRESLTDEQLKATKWLTRCYSELGKDGSILIREMLIHNRSTRQMASSRGMIGATWEMYFARRLYEALDTLAVVFGFSNEHNPLT